MRHLITGLAAVLLLEGCVATPVDESTAVRSIDDDSDYKCEYLGFVSGSGAMGWTTAHDPESAMYDVQNQAAGLGGNAVRVRNIDSSVATTVIVADVYSCEFGD
jgi:hypothetical protein